MSGNNSTLTASPAKILKRGYRIIASVHTTRLPQESSPIEKPKHGKEQEK
jgi:DNA-binding winged helix-turn-helix (wHTH) protein